MLRPASHFLLKRPARSTHYHRTFWRHASSDARSSQSRIDRINARLPKFLHRFTTPLATAPVSHITSFLILHEITAIVPLLTLFSAFHYFNYLPPYITEGAWVKEGIEKFGRYFRRKGWLGDEGGKRDLGWRFGEGTSRVLVEVGAAWAITKALIPLRLVISVWATPWFARWFVLPVTGRVGKFFGRGKKAAAAPGKRDAVGTGATAAGVVPKDVKRG